MRLRASTRRAPAVALGLLLAVVLVAVLAACGEAATGSAGDGATTPAPSGGASQGAAVAIQDYVFDPQTLTVTAGTTVTWTNGDAVLHTVTSADSAATDAATTGLFDASLGQGQSFSFTFVEPGTYYYLCKPHRSMETMHGTVVVE